MSDPTYGWAAVPRSQKDLLSSVNWNDTKPFKVEALAVPNSALAKQVYDYAKAKLPEKTFNHSMRVYYYGLSIVQQHFPAFDPFTETFYITCLLHDTGTTAENLQATKLSFEFYGGMLALDLLNKSYGAPKDQAESVAETIIRHQDLGETGTVSSLCALIHLVTIFDNIGHNSKLVHKSTIESVTAAFPRNGWSGCFAETIEKEIAAKPWCHSTAIDGFAEAVRGNELMQPYE